MRATAEDRHIGIDLASILLPPEKKPVIRMATGVFCFAVCSLLFYGSLIFVSNERLSLSMAFPGVPTWWLQLIFPVCFGVMGVRYGMRLARDLFMWHKGRPA
jgi:TRAP-type C4-dicarboxylate transport system permease small subunit